MHYFKRNIGDYHKKAGRLSILEHGAYTLLMDACYDRERFPALDEAIEWCWARSPEEISAIEFVLSKFFVLTDGLYVQLRIEEEIAAYQEMSINNKRIAQEREEARRLKKHGASTERAQTVHEAPPNHKPLTINQEPITTPQQSKIVACPTSQIIELYKETVSRLPHPRVVPDVVKQNISARWREDDRFKSLDFWKELFQYVDDNKFLSGQVDGRDGRAPFRATLQWIVKAANFAKIVNEDYSK